MPQVSFRRYWNRRWLCPMGERVLVKSKESHTCNRKQEVIRAPSLLPNSTEQSNLTGKGD